MATFNFTDFYIKSPENPKFTNKEIIEDELVRVIVSKFEMIIFTNKGDVRGDNDFGADLIHLLWTTNTDANYIKKTITDQITKYIPEIVNTNYYLNCFFMQNQFDGSDMLFVDFRIREFEVNAFFN